MESSKTSSLFTLSYIFIGVGVAVVGITVFLIYYFINKCVQRKKARRDLEAVAVEAQAAAEEEAALEAQRGADIELGDMSHLANQARAGRDLPAPGLPIDRRGSLNGSPPLTNNSSMSSTTLVPPPSLGGHSINHQAGMHLRGDIRDSTLAWIMSTNPTWDRRP